MLEPTVPQDDESRLAALRGLNILDTPAEERFDRLTRLAQHLLSMPIAVVSLVDSNRQWFKSCQGLDASETPRSISFCGHAILEDQLFIIPDALLDPRFADNPLVTDAPNIRFYAGQPLRAADGNRVGTLCVIDSKPRHLTQIERDSLRDLALLVEGELNSVDLKEMTDALQNSKNRLSAILDNVLDGIITIDERGNVASFNKSAEHIFGFNAEEVIGNNIKMLMPEPYHSEHDGYLHNFVSTGKKKIIGIGREVSGRRKDGSTFPMDLAVSEMRLADKRMFTGIIRDISTRKKEERIQAQFSAIIESSSDAIMSKTLDGIVTSWNPAAEKMFGYSEREMLGQPMARLIPPERLDEEPKILDKIRHGEHIEHFETFRRRKNGEVFPISVTLSPIRDAAGVIIGASKIAHDITERNLAIQTQRDDEARLSAILNNVLDGIITIDEHGNIGSFNKAAEKIFGYTTSEVIGNNVKMLMPEPYHGEHDGYLHNYVSTAHKKIIGIGRQVVGRRKDGSTFPMDLAVSEMQLGAKRMFTGIVRDITERVKIERMKNEFISTVSHELRTPLTSIRGSLALIVGGVVGELPPAVKPLVEIAHKNSERLILLVNDILDMEKIEAGKMEFDMRPIKLMPLVEQAMDGNRAYGEQFKVSYELESTLPDAMIKADANRLMQVFANLLSNAAKFSPSGGKVLIAVERIGQRIRVAVKDNGSGIPDEFKGQMFQKFAQADASDTKKKGGTGLGLSITQAIIEQMGGSIGFTSQPNVLTTFFVEFPVWQEDKIVIPVLSETTGRKRVLICEDDHDIAALLRLMLEQAGLAADIAYDAAQAKQLLAQQPYAAMTLDLSMPNQDGLSLIRELRADKATASLPIVVVSANASEGRKELNGEAFSVIDWIGKPIDQVKLVEALKQAVGQVSDARSQVLHVEDDPDIAHVVTAIVGESADVDNAPTLVDARRMLKAKHYDLAILDMSLPDGSGLDLLPELNSAEPAVPVMVFSASEVMHEDLSKIKSALVKSRTDNAQLLATIKRLIGDA